jgi:hypothetical protein
MKRAILQLLLVASVAGCSSNNESLCVIDEDCFAGEVCRADGTCGDPSGGADGGEADSGSQDLGGSDGTDTGGQDDGGNARADSGADAGTDPDQGPVAHCIVDPFTAICDRPDDNDSFAEYLSFEPRPPGCQDGGDELETNSLTVTDLQMCAGETRDRYTTNLVPCDTKSFFVEVTITPQQPCDPDEYSFNVSVQGNDCEEPGGNVQCTTEADGSKKVTAIVDPSQQVESASITIGKPLSDDVQFDYDLEIVVRE